MTSDIIQQYSKMSTAALKKRAQDIFNAWIRNRDDGDRCISCKKAKVQQAGHYFAAGRYNHLRFNEDNCHGQCIKCNYHEHGNLLNYRVNLEKKIGTERLEALEQLSKHKERHHDNRYLYIEIIQKYKIKKS